MSSSTVQRFGSKTYSRGKETSASRAFDELVSSTKPPVKPTHTKWGKTDYKALRESQRLKGEGFFAAKKPRLVADPHTSQDPFSFDSDPDRKRSPSKKHVLSAKSVVATARLPGTRIATHSAVSGDTFSPDSNALQSEEEDAVIFVPPADKITFKQSPSTSKTYTRSPFANSDETKRKLVHKGLEAKSVESASVSVGDTTGSIDDYEDDNSDSEFTVKGKSYNDSVKKEDSMDVESDDGSLSFKKQPVRTYSESRTQTSSSRVVGTPSKTLSYNVKPRNSRYTDPKLLQEYKRMYVEQNERCNTDVVGSLLNSTVVSKAEIKGDKGTTLIVVCMPKNVEKEATKTVQNRYFGKSGKSYINKPDRNDKISLPTIESDDNNVEVNVKVNVTSTPLVDTDENSGSSEVKGNFRLHGKAYGTVRVRNRVFQSSYVKRTFSPESASSQDSIVSVSSVSKDSVSSISVTPTSVSSSRRYRIFKSRGPPPKEEPPEIVEEEFQEVNKVEPPCLDLEPPTLEHMASDVSPPSSPPMLDLSEETNSDVMIVSTPEMEAPKFAGAVPSSQETESSDTQDTQSIVSEDSLEDNNQQPQNKRRIFKSMSSRCAKKTPPFSLRRKVLSSPKKLLSNEARSPSKAVYNARSWHGNNDAEDGGSSISAASKNSDKQPEVPKLSAKSKVDEKKVPKLTRSVHWPGASGEEAYTSLRVNKEHRQLFTVVKNVKQAFEVQESGETQDFMDDVEYLLEGLEDSEPMSIRCLSCVQLAGKCTQPAFRMHLRAHGIMTKIFCLLHDAHKNPSLALGTATVMYMLSKDRLNMDLEQESLNLMLSLLEVDSEKNAEVTLPPADLKELERMRVRVRELCEQMQEVGNSLDLDTISTGNLAMESLLSLTSRKAGEWFKEELRTVGALDHIVDTVSHCSRLIGSSITSDEKSLTNLKKLDRCLRVLENVTYMNTDNQSYVISYNEALLITSICRVLRACEKIVPLYPVIEYAEQSKEVKESLGYIIIRCVLSILRVLLNVTHDNEYGSTKVGEQGGLMDCILLCIFSTTQFAPTDQKFDILVLCIGLLINMVEHCLKNRRLLMEMDIALPSGPTTALQALLKLFCDREEAAREMEEHDTTEDSTGENDELQSPNKSGEWRETDAGVQWIVASAQKIRDQQKKVLEDFDKEDDDDEQSNSTSKNVAKSKKAFPSVLDDEETFTQALHKAGKHMENSIIASYIALLIGCLIQDNKMYVMKIQKLLVDESFAPLIKILKKFLGFMNLTKAIGNTGGQPIARVIEILEAC